MKRDDGFVHLRSLGTGASGGTPGEERFRRQGDSLLISNGAVLLEDVTRDFSVQASHLDRIDGILMTHVHRDAVGGLQQLHRWWLRHGDQDPIDLFLNEATAEVVRSRYKRLDDCRLHLMPASRRLGLGAFTICAIAVPHPRESRFETQAWRFCCEDRSLVYASDVAYLTPELEHFCAGATVLILDGAMSRRRLSPTWRSRRHCRRCALGPSTRSCSPRSAAAHHHIRSFSVKWLRCAPRPAPHTTASPSRSKPEISPSSGSPVVDNTYRRCGRDPIAWAPERRKLRLHDSVDLGERGLPCSRRSFGPPTARQTPIAH